jgi:uncharacterized repeat protein (TIGR03803 family)
MPNKKSSVALTAIFAIFTATLFTSARATAQVEKIVHTFGSNGEGGGGPSGNLIFDASGNLYGTTLYYGTYFYGTVFELTPQPGGGWTEKVLHSFNGKDGWKPSGGLIFDAAGNLYGTTQQGGTGLCFDHNRIPTGCGTVFELSPQSDGTWTFTTLHNFNNDGTDGVGPFAGLIFDHAGNLYGTTYQGGAACHTVGCGTVFELSPASGGGWTEKILHSFSGKNGIAPYAGLIFDAAGNLYGTTLDGGTYSTGTVFELMPKGTLGWTERVLYSFNYYANNNQGPAFPFSSLVFDAAGNLYGTTFQGGPSGVFGGTVFELTPSVGGTWTETSLHNFETRGDGEQPVAGVVFDARGNLYGTTRSGGAYERGTVFALKPTSGGGWAEAVLHSFGNGTDGDEPHGSLILDPAGNLFGTTVFGGSSGTGANGTVFEIKP